MCLNTLTLFAGWQRPEEPLLIRKGSRPGCLLNRPQWTARPKKSALQGRGTIRKDGGGGIGDSRYFAGMIDNNGTSGKQENGEAPAIPCPSLLLVLPKYPYPRQSIRSFLREPGGDPLPVQARVPSPLPGGHKLGHSWFGSENRTSGEPPVVRPLRAHALHSALCTLHFRTWMNNYTVMKVLLRTC